MGYISKDIAVITEPKIVSLSALPNFVQFASKPAIKSILELNLQVKISVSSNLVNPANIQAGKSINPANGELRDTPNPYGATGYIKVAPNSLYTGISGGANFFRTMAFYASDFSFISGNANAVKSFTTPANAAYVRGSMYDDTNVGYRPWTQQGLFKGANPVFEPWAGSFTEDQTRVTVTASDGTTYIFYGTSDASKVGGAVFYTGYSSADNAENLKISLLNEPWIAANFEIVTPFEWVNGKAVNGDTLVIKALGAGESYQIQVTVGSTEAYLIEWVNATSINRDSISGEASTAEIDLDVYVDPAVFLGEDDRPITAAKIGKYLTTLSKTYTGSPVWFELSALFSQYPKYNTPRARGWFDAGTISVYRFIAKVKALNSFPFYQSNALFIVNGYGRVSEGVDLEGYVYRGQQVKLLTNKPNTSYIKGQKEYLNFIFSDDQRLATNPIDYTLRIIYRAYTTSGLFLGAVYEGEQTRGLFSMVNTFALNIDQVLENFPRAGRVKVAISRGEAIVSNDIEYEIMPECLHTLTQFTFLNRLGGWDSVNLDGKVSDEIKPESATYNKTLTPAYRKGDSIETVYATKLDTPVTIESAPLFDDVAEWLKELAASRAILNNGGEYIIIEDFELKRDTSKKNMQTAKIKYRLSETYTND